MNDIDLSQIQKLTNTMQEASGGGDGSTVFVLSIVFGIIGMFYFYYGKRNVDKDIFLYSGIGLMVYPYLVDGLTSTLVLGVVLTLLPIAVR